MTSGPLVVVGDVLLDREVLGTVDRLCPEAPVPVLAETSTVDRPGGAGLAALLVASPPGWPGPEPSRKAPEVVLVGAFSADGAGERLRELLAIAGIRVVALPMRGPTVEKIRLRAGDHLLLRLDRGEQGGPIGAVPAEASAAIRAASAVLVSDYGRGVLAVPQLRLALAGRAHAVPVVWDPHPRGEVPIPAARLVTPNRSEAVSLLARQKAAQGFQANGHNGAGTGWHNGAGTGWHNGSGTGCGSASGYGSGNGHGNGSHHNGALHVRPWPADTTRLPGPVPGAQRDQNDLATAVATAVRLRRCWSAGAVAVTMAERGAVLSDGVSPPMLVPAPFAARGDSCGAGDRFASAALTAFSQGATVVDAVASAVRAATAFVASGGALALAALEEPMDPVTPVAAVEGGRR